ncbi:VOC family protein [Cumulibacter soli]|uniref:VOC family protein n=1 Tax=Cumulibacter soli TaxID=2546344 RepID=UPI0010674BEC|nr:VOC family protein [Cumulibacter soli]
MSEFDPQHMIDHLVYGTVDLQRAVTTIAEQIGVTPDDGGRHIGLGTRNYLLGLSDTSYLEIIALDPDNPPAEGHQDPFGLAHLTENRLITWAVHPRDIDHALIASRRHGVDHGKLHPMSRVDSAGNDLHWTLAIGSPLPFHGLAPFLIDWAETPHPAASGIPRATLDGIQVISPEPAKISALLRDMKLPIDAEEGDEPALHATITGPKGTITL